jgi:cell wall-associated NlpC family hydrolase
VLLGIFAALLVAVPAFATPSPSVAAKRAEAQRVLGEIHQLDNELTQANERLNLANLKLAEVQAGIKENRYELRVATHNLKVSQKTIARRLVTLYSKGATSTLEVILGARSLVEVMNRIDAESRISKQDATVIAQVRSYKRAIKRHARELQQRQIQVRRLVGQRASQQRAIQSRLGERQRLLSSLNGEIQRLIAAQQARELAASLAARNRALAAQGRNTRSVSDLAVGATAATPEGASVIPPGRYGGVIGVALQFLGTPYVWGGASPSGFDCSGLVVYSYAKFGVSLPHSSYALWEMGSSVPYDQLQAGDLVFFNGLGHMGMYMGAGQFVHSPHTGDVLKISDMGPGTHYAGSFVGARRIN